VARTELRYLNGPDIARLRPSDELIPTAVEEGLRDHVVPLDEDRSSTDDVEQIAATLLGPTVIGTLLDGAGIGAAWLLGERDGW